jgi:predicted N-acetyltransferase YhbS
MIVYAVGGEFDLDDVIELYRASTLGERRPIDDRAIVDDMVHHANLIVTAREGDRLVGIARSLTDFSYVCYLADLAVRDTHQKLGIGRELIARTRAELGPRAMIVLLAAPAAVDYYPKLGFTQHGSAWLLKAGEKLR